MRDIVREIGAKRSELVTLKKDILYRYIAKINPQPRSVPNTSSPPKSGLSSVYEVQSYGGQLEAFADDKGSAMHMGSRLISWRAMKGRGVNREVV